jgi:hypothetical protein
MVMPGMVPMGGPDMSGFGGNPGFPQVGMLPNGGMPQMNGGMGMPQM